MYADRGFRGLSDVSSSTEIHPFFQQVICCIESK